MQQINWFDVVRIIDFGIGLWKSEHTGEKSFDIALATLLAPLAVL